MCFHLFQKDHNESNIVHNTVTKFNHKKYLDIWY